MKARGETCEWDCWQVFEEGSLVKANPLAWWEFKDCMQYLQRNGLERHPLHDQVCQQTLYPRTYQCLPWHIFSLPAARSGPAAAFFPNSSSRGTWWIYLGYLGQPVLP